MFGKHKITIFDLNKSSRYKFDHPILSRVLNVIFRILGVLRGLKIDMTAES